MKKIHNKTKTEMKMKKKKENKIKTKQTKELNRRNSLTKKTSSKQTQTVQQNRYPLFNCSHVYCITFCYIKTINVISL
jgi:uncharacterized membrane protein (DUF106 family)